MGDLKISYIGQTNSGIMKKQMVLAGLALVALKLFYDVCSFVYDMQHPAMERYFNIGIAFFILYYCVALSKKKKTRQSQR